MRHLKIVIAGASLAAVAAGGGVTIASAGSSAASHPPSAQPSAAAATVRTAQEPVGGMTETILVNAGGRHLLYTFASDQANQVTGQGVQDFFVATPGLAAITASSASAGTVPAASSGGGYGY